MPVSAEAVRARLRAIVRDLEARGALDPQPGRTADASSYAVLVGVDERVGSSRLVLA